MKVWLTFVALCLALLVQAQKVDGFWKGTLTISNGCFAVNNIELQIHEAGGSITGDSYHYENTDYYVKKNFAGSYEAGTQKVIVQEGEVTTFAIKPHCNVCIKRYELTYRKEGNREFLVGQWTGFIDGTTTSCDMGYIELSRIKESAFKEIPEVLVDTGTIRLDFYDNAQIDGDSITVLVNKKVVVSHQRLTMQPITTNVVISLRNPTVEVEMIAENEGSIPPNTAMLVITAGVDRYQLFMSSTLQKSARVRFVYKPPPKAVAANR